MNQEKGSKSIEKKDLIYHKYLHLNPTKSVVVDAGFILTLHRSEGGIRHDRPFELWLFSLDQMGISPKEEKKHDIQEGKGINFLAFNITNLDWSYQIGNSNLVLLARKSAKLTFDLQSAGRVEIRVIDHQPDAIDKLFAQRILNPDLTDGTLTIAKKEDMEERIKFEQERTLNKYYEGIATPVEKNFLRKKRII